VSKGQAGAPSLQALADLGRVWSLRHISSPHTLGLCWEVCSVLAAPSQHRPPPAAGAPAQQYAVQLNTLFVCGTTTTGQQNGTHPLEHPQSSIAKCGVMDTWLTTQNAQAGMVACMAWLCAGCCLQEKVITLQKQGRSLEMIRWAAGGCASFSRGFRV